MSRSRAAVRPRPAPAPVQEAGGRSRPSSSASLGRTLPWLVWVLLSALYLRPVLNTTVVADDLVAPFAQFSVSGDSWWDSLRTTTENVNGSGHFNYVGQWVGTVFNLLWLQVASVSPVALLPLYALTKLVVFLLTALAVSAYVRRVCDAVGRQASDWQVRVLVSVALFTTLQLHVVWSNDPVASYPLSGFASAAVGFAVLAVAADGLAGRRAWTVGLLGTAALLYYEINAAVVVAVGVVALWWASAAPTWGARAARLLRCAPALLVPFAVALAAQLRAAPRAESYTGTTVAVGDGLLGTLGTALASGLPASAWLLSRGFLGGPPLLLAERVVVLGLLASVLVAVARRRPLEATAVRVGRAWLLVLAPVVYAVVATAVQAATLKVQAEVTEVGMVYNFYAVSAATVAALLALAVLLVPRTWVRPVWVSAPLGVAAALFVLVQTMVTADLSQRFNTVIMPQNRVLLDAYSDRLPEPQRCDAVRSWTALGLPDYYEDGMVAGLQAAYRSYYGEPFCTGFVRR